MQILWFFIAGAGLGIFSSAIKSGSEWLLIVGGMAILVGIDMIIDTKIKDLKEELENKE